MLPGPHRHETKKRRERERERDDSQRKNVHYIEKKIRQKPCKGGEETERREGEQVIEEAWRGYWGWESKFILSPLWIWWLWCAGGAPRLWVIANWGQLIRTANIQKMTHRHTPGHFSLPTEKASERETRTRCDTRSLRRNWYWWKRFSWISSSLQAQRRF